MLRAQNREVRGNSQILNLNSTSYIYTVAPHAGAWIETFRQPDHRLNYVVAPHAGAWIETAFDSPVGFSLRVAPHAGAWIETR